MICAKTGLPLRRAALPALAVLLLAACAAPKPIAVAPPAPAAPAPRVVAMAPIPNPPAVKRRPPKRAATAPVPRGKPAAPAVQAAPAIPQDAPPQGALQGAAPAAPVATAALPPPPPAPEPPVVPAASQLIGRTPQQVEALLGRPTDERERPPARIRRYELADGCAMEVAYYLDVNRGDFYALNAKRDTAACAAEAARTGAAQ